MNVVSGLVALLLVKSRKIKRDAHGMKTTRSSPKAKMTKDAGMTTLHSLFNFFNCLSLPITPVKIQLTNYKIT